jgi:hypothetical protein
MGGNKKVKNETQNLQKLGSKLHTLISTLKNVPVSNNVVKPCAKGPGRPSKVNKNNNEQKNDDNDDENSSLIEILEEISMSIARLDNEMHIVVKTLKPLNYECDELKNRINSNETKLKKLEMENESIKKSINDLSKLQPLRNSENENCDISTELDKIRQLSNSKFIVLSGKIISDSIKEINSDLIASCKNILNRIPNVKIDPQNIVSAKTYGLNNEKICVEFTCDAIRNTIFKNFFKLQRKPFYIGEVLTPLRSKLFYELRKLKKDMINEGINEIKSVFTRRGSICYVMKSDLKNVQYIDDSKDIVNLKNNLHNTTESEN